MGLGVPFLKSLLFGLLSWRLNHCRDPSKISEIVTPRYLTEGTDSKTVPRRTCMYLVWMGHLDLLICWTWHLDGLHLIVHRFSIFLGCVCHFAE